MTNFLEDAQKTAITSIGSLHHSILLNALQLIATKPRKHLESIQLDSNNFRNFQQRAADPKP